MDRLLEDQSEEIGEKPQIVVALCQSVELGSEIRQIDAEISPPDGESRASRAALSEGVDGSADFFSWHEPSPALVTILYNLWLREESTTIQDCAGSAVREAVATADSALPRQARHWQIAGAH